MNKKMDITITFKTAYSKIPKVKILEPPKADLKYATEKDMEISIPVDPHRTFAINIVYTINNKREKLETFAQFCPACETVLEKWPIIKLSLGKSGSLPVSACIRCGNLFMDRRNLYNLLSIIRGEKSIIIPGRG